MKTTKQPTKQPNQPIHVAIPNTSEVKMQAILHVARAVESLAKTLDSVNTNVAICHNTVSGAKQNGISVDLKSDI